MWLAALSSCLAALHVAGRNFEEILQHLFSAGQLCDDTHLPGWLSAFPAHSQTFKPAQASFVHTNSQLSHSTSSF